MTNTDIRTFPQLTTYGYIKDGKVFLKGHDSLQDREIGVVRDSDEESINYFMKRFEVVRQKVEDVKTAIAEAENKGSYLMKLIHMRTYLADYNGLGPFEELHQEIDQQEEQIQEYIAKNRDKNTAIKKALLSEAESLCDSTDWKPTANRFKELKMNWIKTGSAYEDQEVELSENFNACLDKFFEARNDFMHKQAVEMRERMQRYRDLLDQIRQLNYRRAGAEEASRVEEIKQQWNTAGRLPKYKFSKLSVDFSREIERFERNAASKQAPSPGYDAPTASAPPENRYASAGAGNYSGNYSRPTAPAGAPKGKKELLQEAERILTRGVPYNIQQIKKLQNEWKRFGKVPGKEDKELNLKFRICCNEVFETHFLERSVLELNPTLYNLAPADQINMRLNVLLQTIRQDEADLDEFNYKHGAQLIGLTPKPHTPEYALYQQRNNLVNKIKTKQRIADKLRAQLIQAR